MGSSRPGTAVTAAAAATGGDFTRRDVLVPLSSSHKAPSPVSALAWSHNGKRLAVACEDGTVRVWGIEVSGSRVSERLEYEFSSKECEFVTTLAFSPRKDDVLAVVGGHTTRIMDLRPKSSSVAVMSEAPTRDGITASWDGHGEGLLVGQRGNAFTRLDAKRRRSPRTLSIGQGDEVRDVAFIDRGQRVLISTTYGVEVRSWPAFELLTVLQGHARHLGKASGVTAMATSREEEARPSGKHLTRLLATGGGDATICVWDLQAAVPAAVLSRPNDRLRCLSFSADQALLAFSVGDVPGYANAEVLSVATGEPVVSIPLARGADALAFNPRWPRLLALAEPGLLGRDSKGKDAAALVSLVQLK